MPTEPGRHLSAEKREMVVEALKREPGTAATVIASRLDVGRTTVQGIARELRKKGEIPPLQNRAPSPSPDEARATPAHERRIIQLEDDLREANRKLREAHRAYLSEDAVMQVLGVMGSAPEKPPTWMQRVQAGSGSKSLEVPVAIWSDWHLGEVVEPAEVSGVNAFNIQIGEQRIRRLYDSTVDLCTNHGPGSYPGIVVNLLGDFCSGALHPELAKTDEEEVIPTVLRCRDILITGLTRMADTFGKVYVPCASGNHGRATQKPEFKRYFAKNFDWLIYQLLTRHFEGDPRIYLDIRPANEVHYKVYGLRFLAMHGDMLGVRGGDGIIGALGPIARGETKVRGHSASSDRE